MHTISRESILKEFSRKLKLAAKVLVLHTRRNAYLVVLKGAPVKIQYLCMQNKILYRGLQHYLISSFLVWVAPKLLRTNVINAPLLVSITPRNIYSRFMSFKIIYFTLNSGSNKKIISKKTPKKTHKHIHTHIHKHIHKKRFLQSKGLRLWWLASSRSSRKWIGCILLPNKLFVRHVWELMKLRRIFFLPFYYCSPRIWKSNIPHAWPYSYPVMIQ